MRLHNDTEKLEGLNQTIFYQTRLRENCMEKIQEKKNCSQAWRLRLMLLIYFLAFAISIFLLFSYLKKVDITKLNENQITEYWVFNFFGWIWSALLISLIVYVVSQDCLDKHCLLMKMKGA